MVKLVGTVSNKNGIGAQMTAVTGALRQRRDVDGGSGYLSQPSLPVEFGFGSTTTVDSLIIRWPSGRVQVQTQVATNQYLTITEPGVSDTLSFSDAYAVPGGHTFVEVSLHTSQAVAGLQFTIQPLLNGNPTSLVRFNQVINDLASMGFTVSSGTNDTTGVTAVLLYSESGDSIPAGWRTVLHLVYDIPPETPLDTEISLVVSHDILSSLTAEAIPHIRRSGMLHIVARPGDVNTDGQINILDVIIEIYMIIGRFPQPQPGELRFALGDVNADGEINILDVVAMINAILDKLLHGVTKVIAGPTKPVTVEMGEVQTLASGRRRPSQ